jgi:two-component system sensor histidine kinase VicK
MVNMKRFIRRLLFFRSIQWRLVTILVSIIVVLMTVVWVILNFQVEKIFYADFKDSIERNYSYLSISSDATVDDLKKELTGNAFIAGHILGEGKSFTIIRKSDGAIVHSSDRNYQADPARFRIEIFKSENLIAVMPVSGGASTGSKMTYTNSQFGPFYDYVMTQKLKDGDYVLFFKYDRDKALTVLNKFFDVILLGMCFSVLAALIIGYFLSRTITRPISDIMRKAEKISRGDFGQVLEVKSDDEIGKLSRTFNYMSTKLKETLAEISSEKNKVETILKNMTDGVVAFDTHGSMIHINAAARKILGNKALDLNFDGMLEIFELEMPGFSFHELDEKKDLNGAQHRVEYDGKFLKIQFAAFTDEEKKIEGIVAVIQDITEEQKLENMRREFVANVSHELRTPLTSVKSYTETLLDGAIDNRETAMSFLKVINDETDRMTHLVRDLLILSQHDSGIRLNLEDISLADLTTSCIERLKREADQKGQDLKLFIRQNMPVIKGDRHRMDQLLVNVIGNAIKYTPDKGRIAVSLYCERDKAFINVEDSGIGIPEQDLGRIFERFYRVDKARSRQMGGTGLGLAIAKEIAVLHGGNITAKSKLGRGTAILIELPIKKSG